MNRVAVALTAMLVLTLVACGGGGGSEETVASPGTVTFAESRAAYPAGSVVALNVSGAAPNAVQRVEIGGVPVAHLWQEGLLIAKVPVLDPGTHTLRISTASGPIETPVEITIPVLSSPPAAYVAQRVQGVIEQLEAGANSADGETSGLMKQLAASLREAQPKIASMSDAEARETAYTFAAYSPDSSTLRRSATLALKDGSLGSCANAVALQLLHLAFAAQFSAITGLAIQSFVALPNWVTGLTAIGGFALTLSSMNDAVNSKAAVWDACAEAFGPIKWTAPDFNFASGASKQLAIEEEHDVSEETLSNLKPPATRLGAILQGLHTGLDTARSALSKYISVPTLPNFYETFTNYSFRRTLAGRATDYVISSVSNSDIASSLTDAADRVALKFIFVKPYPTNTPIPFEFRVTRTATGEVVSQVNATLKAAPRTFTVTETVESVQTAPTVSRTFTCDTGTCQATMFCGAPGQVGHSDTFEEELITADTSAVFGDVTGSWNPQTQQFMSQENPETKEVTPVGSKYVRYFSTLSKSISFQIDSAGWLRGTQVDTVTTTWSLDGAQAQCSSTSSYVGMPR